MIWTVLKWAAVVVTSGLAGYGSQFWNVRWVGSGGTAQADVPISYADLAAIAMTAATLALGAVALVVTVVAAVGGRTIKREAASLAKASADKEIQIRLDRDLDGKLSAAITARLEPMLEDMMKAAGKGGKLDAAVLSALGAMRGFPNNSETEQELSDGFDPDNNEER